MTRRDLAARFEAGLGWLFSTVGNRFREIDRNKSQPRDTQDLDWDRHLRSQWEPISEEWHAFRSAGGRLPHVEWVLTDADGLVEAVQKPLEVAPTGADSLGRSASWEMGIFAGRNGRAETLLARHFPATLDALSRIPGLHFALWSVLAPGTEILEHCGPNPGVLRLHFGVDCPEGAAVTLGEHVVPSRNGETLLFDDTLPHGAWNRSDRERVVLFCEVIRPLPVPWHQLNKLAQVLVVLIPRFRAALRRADAWHVALNPRLANLRGHKKSGGNRGSREQCGA